MWMGDGNYHLAGALVTLIRQLEAAYPDREWQTSGGTGTIGDAAHRSEGSASDHNAWLANTVRALDVAKTANGPDCEGLFRMVNRMYAAHDPRVYPYGYAIFNGRITDWGNPGGYHAQQGDQHLTHVHISVGQTGYNATDPWPLTTLITDPDQGEEMALSAEAEKQVEQAVANQLARYFGGKDGHQHTLETLVREALADLIATAKADLVADQAIQKKVGA